ncbi:MAG: hypothetical protein DSZ11_06370 [Sulfurovum sp.]|nr:MAG: hypothetical protein DSZ11_06370 [Sulfurovum sp.]
MRKKKIFISIVFIWSILLALYIYIEKTGIKLFQIDKKVHMIDIKEAQYKINTLLVNNPIVFSSKESSVLTMENNQSLNKIVELLKRVKSNLFVIVSAHTDVEGTNSKNRIVSQKRADAILSFIKSKYPSNSIEAIGYGEEFPLNKEKHSPTNRRIEITLLSLPPKI